MNMRPIVSILPAAVALALASPLYAADVPNFNQMDKNNDGQLTKSEAQANPKLADQFSQVDDDNNGTLSRTEYLAIMGRQDLHNLRENLAEFLNPEGKPPLAAGGEQTGAASAGASSGGSKEGMQQPANAASEQLVRNVQQTLSDKDIDAGPVDGIWGPRTSSGVRRFQEAQGIQPTGQLNAQTLAALGIAEGSASAGKSAAPAEQSGNAAQSGTSAGESGKPR